MFTIRLKTVRFRPDLQVTIRCNIDNWQQDFVGSYQNDEWVFVLPDPPLGQDVLFKFRLERQFWMYGGDLHLVTEPGGEYSIDGTQIAFPPISEVLVESGYIAQRFFEPNLDENKVYDVIVIGSGIGGGVLADQAADLGLEVLVLEAGSYLFPTHVGNLPRQHPLARRVDKNIWSLWDDFKVTNYVNAAGSQYNGGQGFNLGGRSIFWGGLIPRMIWWELERWAETVKWYLEDHGYELAEGLLKHSQRDTEYQRNIQTYLKTQFPDLVPLIAPVAIQQPFPGNHIIPAGVFSTADLLLESRLTEGRVGSQHLTINLNHPAVQIETNGSQANAVLAHDLIADQQRRFQAKQIVLSAGTVESAKLALLSNLQDPNQKIGVGITDHPIFFLHFAVPASSTHYDPNASAKFLLRHKNAGVNQHRYNIVVELGTDFNQGRFIDPDILDEQQRVKGNTMLCELVFMFDTPLMDQNTLMQNGQSYVKPVVNMQESPITAQEWQEINDLKTAIVQALDGEALENSSLDLIRAPAGGVAHEVGTLRMGTDKDANYTDGVVDADLKFNAYDNLYVCDLSVFPSSPAANPTLTLTALALRLAEHLFSLT